MLLPDLSLVPLSVHAAYGADSLDEPHRSTQSLSLLFPSDNDRNLGEAGQHGEKGEEASSSCPESCPPLPEDSEAQSIKLSSSIRRFLDSIGSDCTTFRPIQRSLHQDTLSRAANNTVVRPAAQHWDRNEI